MSSHISLAGTASYLPADIVPNEVFVQAGAQATSAMFRGSKTRHHVAPGESATDMIEAAARKLADRLDLDLTKDVDLLLTNVSILDIPFTGVGASVAHRLGMNPKQVLDIHNTGCISFIYMTQLAKTLMLATGARSALICNVQNSGGRVFSHPGNLGRPQSAIPGDGCGVGYLVADGDSPVLAIDSKLYGAYADDMHAKSDDGNPWWGPRDTPMHIDFTPRKIAMIIRRGNRIVPAMIKQVCEEAGVETSDIDVLITNQPNTYFLRNWREALMLPEEAQVHTFEEHGNTFGAAIPISLERAELEGKLKPGNLVVIGGFSHAGDYAAAAVIRWKAGEA